MSTLQFVIKTLIFAPLPASIGTAIGTLLGVAIAGAILGLYFALDLDHSESGRILTIGAFVGATISFIVSVILIIRLAIKSLASKIGLQGFVVITSASSAPSPAK